MENENLENIGLEVDKIDNLLAGYNLPLGAEFHLEQTKTILQEISLSIKKALLAETGVNVWDI
jgi:hypothetical protein